MKHISLKTRFRKGARLGSIANLVLPTLAASAVLALPAYGREATIPGSAGGLLSEADIAVSPANANTVVVVSKDIAAGRPALTAYRSSDGGHTFTGGVVVGGSYLGLQADASDPVVVFDRAGRANFGQLVWTYPGSGFNSLLGLQQSTDGGASWSGPVTAVTSSNDDAPLDFGSPPSPSTTNDKEWLAADSSPAGVNLYLAWVQVRFTASGRQKNRVAFARSSNGGASFSQPRLISNTARFALGPQVVALANGEIHVTWASTRSGENDRRATVMHSYSSDGGLTFSSPRTVARYRNGPAAYNLVSLAASTAGRLMACWAGGAGRGSQAICSYSRDGRRWRQPRPVGRRRSGSTDTLVAVGADSSFWLTFYRISRRRTTVSLWRARPGGSFRKVRTLAKRGFKLEGFVGDYTGLEVTASRVYAAYVLPRSGPRSRNAIFVESIANP